jgi:uncharacterized protein
MTIPIDDSILYVEPIYVKALNANALPEQKKVIVYFRNQVVMEDTLERALARVFPVEDSVVQPPVPTPVPTENQDATVEELIRRANDVFAAAQNAQKTGNWADYGDRLAELEDILRRLNSLTGGAPSPEIPPAQNNQ